MPTVITNSACVSGRRGSQRRFGQRFCALTLAIPEKFQQTEEDLESPTPIAANFQPAQELATRLAAAIRGEVRFDDGSRALYATDASNYRQVPIGVVLPRDTADVETTIALCREFDAPVLSRGGGTSLAGQCCNTAVVLDFSKYMQAIHSL